MSVRGCGESLLTTPRWNAIDGPCFFEQTFEGRRENLSQANKLSRTYAVLLDALNRHRGKGQQKVTVEHVHVHSGGQAIVGMVETPGGGDRPKAEEQDDAR